MPHGNLSEDVCRLGVLEGPYVLSFGLLWEFLDREVDEGTPSRTHAYRQTRSHLSCSRPPADPGPGRVQEGVTLSHSCEELFLVDVLYGDASIVP